MSKARDRRGPRNGPSKRHGPPRPPGPPRQKSGQGEPDRAPAADRGWDHVAAWYDRLIGDEGSDYHRNVIIPTALRLLDVQPGERLLDLCCGQGVLTRAVLER